MANASNTTSQPDDRWARALSGDRDAFEEAIAPHHDTLMEAAHRKIAARIDAGELREGALTPEELVGETMIRAFDHRDRYEPDQMSFRAWLVGIQYRTLNRLIRDEHSYDDQKALSLDAEVPTNDDYDAVEESFYEFRQPFDVTTYAEMIPSQQPGDVEIDPRNQALTQQERDYLDASGLPPEHRHLVEFHDEFELSLSEVAQIMEYSLRDTAEALGEARMHVRHYIGSTDADDVAEDEPIDSYTGEPIRQNPSYPDTSTDSDNDTATRA